MHLPFIGSRTHNQGKILGGYFEEWSIYYAGYNIANLQQNGVANKLTHLLYAFGNVTTTPAPACAIADTWADYQSPYLPSVNGSPYPGPLYGNFAAIQQLKGLHPNLKVLMSLGGASASQHRGLRQRRQHRRRTPSPCRFLYRYVYQRQHRRGITAPGLFNGFNIDWEFPTATDTQNFTALLTEFRSQLNALSKTTGKAIYACRSMDRRDRRTTSTSILPNAAKQVDFITIDGYNYSGSWVTQTNEASPLFDSRQDPLYGQQLDIDDTVNAYLKAGVPASKYTMGLPLYGAGWTGRSQREPWLVPEFNRAFPCSPGEWNRGVHGPQRQHARLRHPADSRTAHLFDAFHANRQRLQQLLRSAKSRNIALRSTGEPFTPMRSLHSCLKMIYVNLKVPGGLGGAYVWALKDDDANGTMVKTMAAGLGH